MIQNSSIFYNGSNFSNQAYITRNVQPPFAYPLYIIIISKCVFPVVILSVAINFAVLLTFIRRPRLITPFSIHLVNLTIINLLGGGVYEIMFLSRNLNREVYRGNRPLCGTFLYVQWSIGFLPALQHAIICIDRLLAIYQPHWYRRKRVKFGIISTILAVLYVQAWYLPLFVANTNFPWTADDLCDTTQVWIGYHPFARFFIIILPQLVIFLGYPSLLRKLWKRRHTKVRAAMDIEEKTGPAAVLGHQPPESDRSEITRTKHTKTTTSNRELQMTVCLVAVQFLFWSPSTFLAGLSISGYYVGFPNQDKIAALSYIAPAVLLVIDPTVNLIFMQDLRREVFRNLHLVSSKKAAVLAAPMTSGGSVTERKQDRETA